MRWIAWGLAIGMIVSAALGIVAAPARATTYPGPAYSFVGTVAGERSGAAALLMDLNADGVADLVVGSPYNGTSSSGSVTFYLSADVGGTLVPFRTVLTVFGWPDSYFGWSLANARTFLGSATALAVGAPFASPNGHTRAGNVTFFLSGAGFDGTASFTLDSSHDGEEFGYAVAAAGDVNGEGYADVLVGAPLCSGGLGCAYVFLGGSPPSSLPSMTYTTASAGANFGFSVAGGGSVDSNGALDIAVGAPGENSGTGAVYVIRNLMASGGSANRTTVVAGVAAGDHFGESVAMGDFNGDTFSDVAAGAPEAASGAGTVSVLYGASKFTGSAGTVLSVAAGENFGAAVATGNLHRDAYTDLLVGAPASTLNATGIGRAYAFYGGSSLATSPNLTLVPGTGDRGFGSSVSVGGDFDGDGGPDFTVADPQFAAGFLMDVGRTAVYAGTVVPGFANPEIRGWVCQPYTWDAATETCLGLPGFTVTLQSPTATKTNTTSASGYFTLTAVPGTYFLNTTLFPYIENTTTLTLAFNHAYTVLVFPLKTPEVYGYACDAVNRTAYPGVTVALYNATGVLVNSTVTPGTPSRNYSIYIPPAFLPAVGASLGLTAKMWDATHYLNSTSVSVARNETANGSMFLDTFPAVSGIVRDASTTLPVTGAAVSLTQGSTVLATATTNQQGAYRLVAVNASVPGDVYFNVTATGYERAQGVLSADQNQPYVQDFRVQSDTIAPTSQISPTLPAYTATATFAVAATASDNYPNNVAQVQLYVRFNNTGSFALYATDTSSPYTFSFNPTAGRGDGRYSFYTIATDYGGNRQSTPTGNMTWTIVDTRTPRSTLAVLPTYETHANFTLGAMVSDWNPISQVALYYRQGATGAYSRLSADTASPYRWSFNTTLLGTGDGVYQFYSLATDAAGNVEPIPATPGAQTTVDTTPPDVAVTAPTAGQVVGTGWVNVTWTATDATSGLAKVDVKLDDAWVHAGTGGYHNFTLVPDGAHTLTVNATDLAGNSHTVTSSFSVSTVTPVVTITAPTGSGYLNTSSVQVTWSLSNTGAGLASIQVRLDNGAWRTVSATATSYTFASVPDGTHSAYVQALGLNGAQATASVTVKVDATPPAVQITSPSPGADLTSPNVTVTWTAPDSGSGVSLIQLALDSGTYQPVLGTSMTLKDLAAGSHTIRIRAADVAGNVGTASVTFTVSLPSTPPPPSPSLDPLVVAAIAAAVVVVVVVAAAALYLRRKKVKAPEPQETKPEEPPKEGGTA